MASYPPIIVFHELIIAKKIKLVKVLKIKNLALAKLLNSIFYILNPTYFCPKIERLYDSKFSKAIPVPLATQYKASSTT